MKARFLTELHLSYAADDSKTKTLDSQLMYESEIAEQVFTVPAGFNTDLASVPRLPLAYMLFGGIGDAAAVVHDYLYSTKIVSRKMADDVLSEAMAVSGIPAWKRGPMWLGVRLFGGGHWNSKETPTTQNDTYFG